MSSASDSEDKYVELVQISDPVEADLLAVYLDNTDLEYQVLDRTRAPVLAGMLPKARRPVRFRVLRENLAHAQELIEEYRQLQAASLMPSDAPPPADDSDSTQD